MGLSMMLVVAASGGTWRPFRWMIFIGVLIRICAFRSVARAFFGNGDIFSFGELKLLGYPKMLLSFFARFRGVVCGLLVAAVVFLVPAISSAAPGYLGLGLKARSEVVAHKNTTLHKSRKSRKSRKSHKSHKVRPKKKTGRTKVIMTQYGKVLVTFGVDDVSDRKSVV